MPLDASIEFPQADVRALFAQMARAEKSLGYTTGHSLQSAVRHLTQTLGRSTRVAPKNRQIRELKGLGKERGLRSFQVENWENGKRSDQIKHHESLATAKRYSGPIWRRGLARESWGAAVAEFRARASGFSTSARVKRLAKKYGKLDANFRADNPWAIITNRLRYIESALVGGPQTINTALSRAASAMEKSIDRQIAKKMGAA